MTALHAEAEAYLKMVADWQRENDLPPPRQMGAPRLRKTIREAILKMRPALPEMIVEERVIPARSGPLAVRLIRGVEQADDVLPVVLYFHGGGYVYGGIEESAHEACRLAERVPALVVSADYRKAPEKPFPAAVEDGYDALLWVYENARRYGGDARRLMVGGTSAGGGLAVAVTRLAAISRGPRIGLNYLFCPWLDLTMAEPSVKVFGQGYGLDRPDLDWFAAAYAGEAARDDPLLSPARHEPPANMPETAIVAAGCDPLVGEARRYSDRLMNAGVPVVHHEAEGMVHAFNVLLHFMPAGDAHLAAVEAAMRRV